MILLVACQQSEEPEEEPEPKSELVEEIQDEDDTIDIQTVESSDGSLRIQAGSDWELDDELNPRALIALSNRAEEKYFVVYPVAKASMASDTSLSDFIDAAYETIQTMVENIDVLAENETVFHDRPAKEIEMKAEIDDVKLHYFVTFAETDEWYYQISSWSLDHSFEKYRDEFKAITDSLEVVREPDPLMDAPTSEVGDGKPVTIVGDEGKSELTFPSGWIELDDIHPEGSIQASRIDSTGEHFFVSIADPRQDFGDDMTLEMYHDLLIDIQSSLIQNTQYSAPSYLTINGNEALQFELTGEIDKVKIGYLFTIIQTDEFFYQTFFWTQQDELAQHTDAYREIIQSFNTSH